MMISGYSILTAIILFSVGTLLAAFGIRKYQRFTYRGVDFLLFFTALLIFRLVFSFETSQTMIVRSYTILPAIRDFYNYPLTFSEYNFSVGNIIVFIWLAIALVKLLQLMLCICKDLSLIKALRSENIVNAEINAIFKQIVDSSSCQLIVSPKVSTPMATGFFRPTILLPCFTADFEADKIRHIMLHEYQHIKGRDVWIKLLVNVLRCLFWWNPVMYMLQNDLEHMLELRCDTKLTGSFSKPEREVYLQTVASVVLLQGTAPPPKAAISSSSLFIGITEKVAIRQRITTIRKYTPPSKTAYISICSIMLLFLVFSYGIIFQPTGYPTDEDLDVDGWMSVSISFENSYIIAHEDGTYSVYYNDEYFTEALPEELDYEPYNSLPIYDE